ncbi:MAG: hypothetical protein IPM36_20305 [Lewinellaceae bacterium]|nr:hypothetical protein [Lewinellaceae bacterium]
MLSCLKPLKAGRKSFVHKNSTLLFNCLNDLKMKNSKPIIGLSFFPVGLFQKDERRARCMRNIGKALFILLMFNSFLGAVQAQKPTRSTDRSKPAASPKLNGVYVGNDKGLYYVTQKGNSVYWFAEHSEKKYSHVFFGSIEEQKLEGKWYAVPKYGTGKNGSLNVKISDNGKLLEITNRPAGFGATSLKKTDRNRKDTRIRLPKQTEGSFTANTIDDLDGTWKCSDGATYYVRQVGDVVVWFGESPFAGGQPDYANVFVGKRKQNKVEGYLVDVPKGKSANAFDWAVTVDDANKMSEIGGRRLTFTRTSAKENATAPRPKSNTQTRPGGSKPPVTTRPGSSKPPADSKKAKKEKALLTVTLPNCKDHKCASMIVIVYYESSQTVATTGKPVLSGKDGQVSFSLPEGNYIINADFEGKSGDDLHPYQSKRVSLRAGIKHRVSL